MEIPGLFWPAKNRLFPVRNRTISGPTPSRLGKKIVFLPSRSLRSATICWKYPEPWHERRYLVRYINDYSNTIASRLARSQHMGHVPFNLGLLSPDSSIRRYHLALATPFLNWCLKLALCQILQVVRSYPCEYAFNSTRRERVGEMLQGTEVKRVKFAGSP
jgi:hypothetical protein